MAVIDEALQFTGTGDRNYDRSVLRQFEAGNLVRIAEGIYGRLDGRSTEEFVYANWTRILAKLVPNAVLSGRTAISISPTRVLGEDKRPTYPGWVYCTHSDVKSPKRFSLPGLEIRSLPGPGPMEGDTAYLGTHLPAPARTLLENLKPSRGRDGPSRNLGREGVETQIERLLKTDYDDGLRAIRKRAHEIAPLLDATEELKTLDDLIGTFLGTRQAKIQDEKVAARQRRPLPFDPECMERLKTLAVVLNRAALPDRPDPHTGQDERACVSFIEAYFTNFIEGTRFAVDKARRIVFEEEEPDGRPADGRDILQTFRQVSVMAKGMPMAATFAEFVDEMKERNRMLLDARPEKNPGVFKTEPNYAGETEFVHPDLLEGTLKEGFETLQSLTNPTARGIFTHTLLVLTHPFNDGNGRTSRIMMTKEIVGGGQCRIVVPAVYRNDYIDGLKAIAAQPTFNATIIARTLLEAQRIANGAVSPNLDKTIDLWASTYAFIEDDKRARLSLPNPDLEIVRRAGIPAPAAYWQEMDLLKSMEDDGSTPTLGI